MDTEIITLDRIDITTAPWSWPFAVERRTEIASYFAELQRQRSGIWNGRAILMQHYEIKDRVLRGTCFETDYASLCAWRHWQFPDRSVYNVFAAAALQAADGAWLAGEMAPDTAAAGLVYFPCGTPEPEDIDGAGRLDLAGNLARELIEEIGMTIEEFDAAPGWTLVHDRGYFGLMKHVTARADAQALRGRIMAHIAQQEHPEFVDIDILRGPDDLTPKLPSFMVAFLEHAWRP